MGKTCATGMGLRTVQKTKLTSGEKIVGMTKENAIELGVTEANYNAMLRACSLKSPRAIEALKGLGLTRRQALKILNEQKVQTLETKETISQYFRKGKWNKTRVQKHKVAVDEAVAGVEKGKKTVTVTAGLSGSGKGGVQEIKYFKDKAKSVRVNNDVSKFSMAKQDKLKSLDGYANAYQKEGKHVMMLTLDKAIANELPITLDITMNNIETTRKMLVKLRKAGYEIEGAFAKLEMRETIENTLFRALKTGDKRFVDPFVPAGDNGNPLSHWNILSREKYQGGNLMNKGYTEWYTNVPYGKVPILYGKSAGHPIGREVVALKAKKPKFHQAEIPMSGATFIEVWAISDGEDDFVDGISKMDFNHSCFNCVHFNEKDYSCKAFDVIPADIIAGGTHTQRVRGQEGDFVYEKK
jgi:hypothetical protein